MTARDTQILIYRLQDQKMVEPYSHLGRDMQELTETCERLQTAENILQKLVSPYNAHDSGQIVESGNGRMYPESAFTSKELEYLESLMT
jgi:hypothetical protein